METTITQLKTQYETLKSDYLARKGRRDQLIENQETLTSKMTEVKLDMELKEKTAILLRKLGERARSQAKENVEFMVSNALQFVFNEDIQFKIQFDEKRGRPEAKFLIISNYEGKLVEVEPEDARGGGVVDVISITLRIALAELFGIKGPMIMDEPAKHLSSEYIQNFAVFLRQISEQFNRQIIMVTHNTTLAECGDKSYLVTQRNGVTKVQEIEKLNENEETEES